MRLFENFVKLGSLLGEAIFVDVSIILAESSMFFRLNCYFYDLVLPLMLSF